jgi:hypothetical protein
MLDDVASKVARRGASGAATPQQGSSSPSPAAVACDVPCGPAKRHSAASQMGWKSSADTAINPSAKKAKRAMCLLMTPQASH